MNTNGIGTWFHGFLFRADLRENDGTYMRTAVILTSFKLRELVFQLEVALNKTPSQGVEKEITDDFQTIQFTQC